MRKILDLREEVPFTCGYSKDGKRIYCDSRLPKTMRLQDGRQIDIDRYLIVHETVEKALEDGLGFHYLEAHEMATAAERRLCEIDGVNWSEYDRFMQRWIAKIGKESLDNIPKDLDLKPATEDDDDTYLKKLQPFLKRVNK